MRHQCLPPGRVYQYVSHTSGDCSINNKLQAMLTLLSLLSAVLRINYAFITLQLLYLRAHGHDLLIKQSATKQQSAVDGRHGEGFGYS